MEPTNGSARQFCIPLVVEIPFRCEPISPDDLGLFPRKGQMVSEAYQRQLEFHEYELAHAEQRGFPEGQVNYHVQKIERLKAILPNIVEVVYE